MDHTRTLFSSRRYPIRYLVIPKSGCTFVKNLIWSLDHDGVYQNGKRIHDRDDDFARASDLGLTDADIQKEDYAFMTVRKPVDRFFSLYLDKIIGPGYRRFVDLRELLIEKYDFSPMAVSFDQHRRNCQILINWLADNLETGEKDGLIDAHWTPQSYRGYAYRPMNLKVLLLPELNEQLPILLSPIVPDIRRRIMGLERNATSGHLDRYAILDEDLREQIKDVYRKDQHFFFGAKRAWAKGVTSNDQIPRVQDII